MMMIIIIIIITTNDGNNIGISNDANLKMSSIVTNSSLSLRNLDVDTTGIEYLKKVAGIPNEADSKSLVSEYDELCDLWDKWDAPPEPKNESETPEDEGERDVSKPIKEEEMEGSQSKASQSTRANG